MNGLESALPGNNISSSNPKNFSFDSNYPPLAVPLQSPPLSDTVNYTFLTNPSPPGSGSTLIPLATIPHGLEYVPVALVYVLMAFQGTNPSTTIANNSYLLAPCPLSTGDFIYNWIDYETDDNQLVINYRIDSGGESNYIDVTNMQLVLKYYIFSTKLR